MRYSFALICFVICAAETPAFAQTRNDQFSNTPICSDLENKSGYTIYGSVETNTAKLPNGETSYYKSNFRLAAAEKTRICSSGPFYEGQRLTLTLRSLLPLFECKTRLGEPIAITATRRKDDRGYDWSATCR